MAPLPDKRQMCAPRERQTDRQTDRRANIRPIYHLERCRLLAGWLAGFYSLALASRLEHKKVERLSLVGLFACSRASWTSRSSAIIIIVGGLRPVGAGRRPPTTTTTTQLEHASAQFAQLASAGRRRRRRPHFDFVVVVVHCWRRKIGKF